MQLHFDFPVATFQTKRNVRLRELLMEHSKDAALIVM